MNMDLGKTIKRLRVKNGLTQNDLAIKLKITKQTLNNYEKGKRKINIRLLAKLCVIFDITADEVLEIETKEQREKILKNLKKGKQ